MRAARALLSGWGRFPVAEMDVYRPERMSALADVVRNSSSVLARGLGRSYGDAALNGAGAVVLTERLNRFLDFDLSTGVLRCEAGVAFTDILQFFVQRGFFPPVAPGTRFITVGGAVACDIHGKNHHGAGSIARHVLDLTLITADGTRVTCSRAMNAELFQATLGGMGLTGIIAEATLRLTPISSAYLAVDYDRAKDLDEALALFHDSDARYAYSVAWIDCLAKGSALGRSVLMRGNHLAASDLAPSRARNPFDGRRTAHVGVPVDLPSGLMNASVIRAFNAAYYRRHPERARDVPVHHERFFFPLDRIANWNRLYGRRGFVQYQCVLPFDRGRDGLVRLLELISALGRCSFLAVLKTFGESEPGAMLSFPMAGYTLALDLPNRPDVLALLDRLDEVVLGHGGRVYLAKDARLRPERFRAMYPQLPRWLEVKERVDPAHRFSSDLSRRLRLSP
jgi:decaprenylphospho-beta-D-ribofuranose 2-oxidase